MKTDKNSRINHPVRDSAQPEQAVPDSNHTQNILPVKAEDSVPLTFTYARKQALADGVQVDVSEMARQAGFRVPVFVTDTVYNAYVKVPMDVEGQDKEGRLRDLLWMLACAIRKGRTQETRLSFQLYVRNDNAAPQAVTLHAVMGPLDIDDPTPSLTIMLPQED